MAKATARQSKLAQAVRAVVVAMGLTAVAAPVTMAQTPGPAAQEAAFKRMYAAPTDPQAILDYARISVALRDFEAAAAALERLIALEPQNMAARQQLALAYFALGSNAMAERQLQIVAAGAGVDPAVAAQAKAYGEAARNRRAVSQISGSLRLGSVFSSDPSARSTDSDFALIWRHDLGGARGHFWLTTLNGSVAFASGAGALSDRYGFSLRSGPIFSLGTTKQSPRVQPFVMLGSRRDDQAETIRHSGAGLMLQLPLGDRFAVTAETRFGQTRASYSGTDGRFTAHALQATYRFSDRTSLRAQTDHEVRRGFTTGREVQDSTTLELWHQFRPAFSQVDKDWRIIASLRHENIREGAVTSTSRTAGVVLRAWAADQIFADIGITRTREVDGITGTTTPTRFSLRIGREF